MRVVAGVDQLGVYPHFVGRALHTALDDMCHTELLTDFAQIARRAAFVLHDARAADHFEIRDLCEVGQDLVLDAFGEEGVRFFFAQIFERKDRDAFVRRDIQRHIWDPRCTNHEECRGAENDNGCGRESDARASHTERLRGATLQERC